MRECFWGSVKMQAPLVILYHVTKAAGKDRTTGVPSTESRPSGFPPPLWICSPFRGFLLRVNTVAIPLSACSCCSQPGTDQQVRPFPRKQPFPPPFQLQ